MIDFVQIDRNFLTSLKLLTVAQLTPKDKVHLLPHNCGKDRAGLSNYCLYACGAQGQ